MSTWPSGCAPTWTWAPVEPMVDADPIRMFLFRWMIETGDPIEVVARGFDVDEQLLIDILERRQATAPPGPGLGSRSTSGRGAPA